MHHAHLTYLFHFGALFPDAQLLLRTRTPQVDGKISFKELLPWFLNVGRSYLPAPHYPAIVELDEPSEEQLRALFEAMDEDNSGTVNLAEATEGTLTLWPFVDEQLVANAFEAADADRSDLLQFEEFDELVRCLQFLNRKRHEIAELMGHFVCVFM